MMNVLAVGMGGALGAILRYGAGTLASAAGASGYATMIVNIVGSGLMGLLLGWLVSRNVQGDSMLWLFLGTGLLGGFTTFSTFSREAVHFINQDEWVRASIYIGGSVIGSLALFVLALSVTKRMLA